jgi:hypothetical protein
MELLLNLFWLMLVVPAFWLWRREPVSIQRSRSFTAVGCVLSLVCILILLFPVISATDDLQAMRQETAESSSSPSKRIHRQGAGDKPTMSLSNFVTAHASFFGPDVEVWGQVLRQQVSVPGPARLRALAVRAPPRLFLS